MKGKWHGIASISSAMCRAYLQTDLPTNNYYYYYHLQRRARLCRRTRRGSNGEHTHRSDEFKYQISSAINWPMLSDSFTSSHNKKPDNHCRNNNNYCETHIVIHDYKICRENIKVNVGMVGLLLLSPCTRLLNPRERYSADIAIFTVPSRRRCWPFIPSASHSTPTIVHIFSTLHTTPTSPIPALVKVQGIVLHRFIFFKYSQLYRSNLHHSRDTHIYYTAQHVTAN